MYICNFFHLQIFKGFKDKNFSVSIVEYEISEIH